MRLAGLFASLLGSVLMMNQTSLPKADAQGAQLAFVGTYTNDKSVGIYSFRLDSTTGSLAALSAAARTPNPSYLALSSDGTFLFAVNERSDFGGERSGSVTSFAVDGQTGKLTEVSVQSSRGADPCHLALDRTGKFLAVANYTGGSVAVLPVGAEGRLGPAVSVARHTGRGADPKRQEGPHAHHVLFTADNRFLVVTDLGLDRLVAYRFDPATGALERHDSGGGSLPPGTGPRHLAFNVDDTRAWVLNELASTITALEWDGRAGTFRPGRAVSTLPEGFTGSNTTAALKLHPNGRFLYGSNRGHDSIASFSIEEARGLSFLGTQPSRGKTPRDFAIDASGRWIVAANQGAGTLSVFSVDLRSGRLAPAGTPVDAGTPVCVVFVK